MGWCNTVQSRQLPHGLFKNRARWGRWLISWSRVCRDRVSRYHFWLLLVKNAAQCSRVNTYVDNRQYHRQSSGMFYWIVNPSFWIPSSKRLLMLESRRRVLYAQVALCRLIRAVSSGMCCSLVIASPTRLGTTFQAFRLHYAACLDNGSSAMRRDGGSFAHPHEKPWLLFTDFQRSANRSHVQPSIRIYQDFTQSR